MLEFLLTSYSLKDPRQELASNNRVVQEYFQRIYLLASSRLPIVVDFLQSMKVLDQTTNFHSHLMCLNKCSSSMVFFQSNCCFVRPKLANDEEYQWTVECSLTICYCFIITGRLRRLVVKLKIQSNTADDFNRLKERSRVTREDEEFLMEADGTRKLLS
ncbi:hypothetical protein CR513_25810, partial [Mucuna pruriens]